MVAGLGAANWYVKPERARTWLIGMGTMVAVWLVVTLLGRMKRTSSQTESEHRFVVLSAVTAGLMLVVSLGTSLVDAIGLGGGTLPQRAWGVAMGLMLMVIGNAVPKVIGPLEGRCSPAKWQSEQRFSGWVFTLAGLAYTTLWVFAPVAHAADASMLVCAAALVLVLARLAWRVFKS